MQVIGGTETITIIEVTPGTHLRIDDVKGDPLATMVADASGNAHLAFAPTEHRLLATMDDLVGALATGTTVPPGDYTVTDLSTKEVQPVRVLAVDDHPDLSLYDQELADGYGYLTVRDGIRLSVMVRPPNADMYGPGPYPTVVEYSGYSPSHPELPQPGTLLANLMGFAVVGVNMRGTGCSGGVFDVFSPAQSADGYDVIETVARQPWVLHGKVGMVGLSYPGISQLYVAATRPPSLAAITPLSVIDDLWRQQWPGGTFNSGFTRAWLALRDAEAMAGGQAWDQAIIEAGDEVAAANQAIRSQNLDFERFGRAIETYGPISAGRRAGDFVDRIEVPVYLTGAWQDEQTGSRFALMLQSFTSAPSTRFTLFNGHHPDGYSPMVILRWFEFLSFHVARRIPRVNELIRQFAPLQFIEHFGYQAVLEPDRFDQYDSFDEAFAAYLAEPSVRILFDSGAGHEVVGATSHVYETTTESFPPPGVTARSWWFAPEGTLADEPPSEVTTARYLDDVGARDTAYSQELLVDLNRFTQPRVPITWTRFATEHRVEMQTEPFVGPVVIAGQGHLDLWLRPGTEDTSVQVTVTEIRPDGDGGDVEQRVQCGWHRLKHASEDPTRSNELAVDYTFVPEDIQPLVPGQWIRSRVPIYPVTHVFREGSKLRVRVSTPGRDHPFWNFESPVIDGAGHDIGIGGDMATALVLPVWDVDLDHGDHPPAGSLRGQPVRPAEPVTS